MAYLVIGDLNTHLREEIIDKITRNDDTIVDQCIEQAIQEAKGYLGKYDLDALFDPDNDSFVDDPLLKQKVKSIACWYIVQLANPNVSIEMMRTGYEDAIDKYFKEIQKGNIDPPGWVYKTDDEDTGRVEGSGFYSSYNTKRTNHW